MALVQSQGVESDLVPRIATGFGGGIAKTLESNCGAVSGGVIAAGIFLGRDRPESDCERAYALVRNLLADFREQFGSTICCQLTGLDPQDADWREKYYARNLREERCVQFVRFVVLRWLKLAAVQDDKG